jgi:hypothetical protein
MMLPPPYFTVGMFCEVFCMEVIGRIFYQCQLLEISAAMIYGSERSASVIALKNHFKWSIVLSDCDLFGHFIFLVVNCNIIITTTMYGYNSKLDNDQLLESLESVFSIG